ncbi:rhodanese-like domain-containing protein [Undibacterium arcticum]|uniref:Rhodanese-like domain-containing protein n=1 Tax=Undibacterium arcticum TaxID=1762892 RepID=A0ABV7F1J7_9BURK
MKFIVDNIFLIGIALVAGGALLFPSLQRRGSTLSLLQATQLINKGRTTILDVREPAEFASGHLRDAKNIPLVELPNRIGELEKSKAKPLIVVCQTGTRSAKAEAQLKKAGFAEVSCLGGGLAAWQAQGLPTVK